MSADHDVVEHQERQARMARKVGLVLHNMTRICICILNRGGGGSPPERPMREKRLSDIIWPRASLRCGGGGFPSCCRHSIDSTLLVDPQPGFVRLSQHRSPDVVHEMANHDEREGDRIHPVDVKVENSNAYHYAPEVARQEGDVEKCGRGESEQDGSQGIEE